MLFYLLLVQLVFGAVLSAGTSKCKTCNTTTESCENNNSLCEVFELCINSTELDVQEGADITMMCNYNISKRDLTVTWWFNDKEYEDKDRDEDQSQDKLVLKKVLTVKNGNYSCKVDSCQSEALTVKVNDNSVIIIVICGVAALALIVIMGVVMKIKLKRDNAQHKERMKQRAQAEQNARQAASPQGGQ